MKHPVKVPTLTAEAWLLVVWETLTCCCRYVKDPTDMNQGMWRAALSVLLVVLGVSTENEMAEAVQRFDDRVSDLLVLWIEHDWPDGWDSGVLEAVANQIVDEFGSG